MGMTMWRKAIVFFLLAVILASFVYLGWNVWITRTGAHLIFRMTTTDWHNENTIDQLVKDFKPRYDHFLYSALKSPDFRERLRAAYILARQGKKEPVAVLAAGLKEDDWRQNRMATDLLWSLWFNQAGIDSREILHNCQDLMSQKKYEEAIVKLTKLSRRKPQFAEVYNQRALAYFLKGDYERSITDCKNALELNPIHFGAQSGMGECYMKLKKWELAREALEKAIKITPHASGTQDLLEAVNAVLLRRNKRIA